MNETDRTDRRQPPGPIVTRRVDAPVEAVWAVFADGWSYATWVVGASRVRAVDAAWPAEGSRIHHSFGPWPLTIQDYTRAERSDEPTDLVLTARGWPIGEARVQLHVQPLSADECEVQISEDAVSGPGRLVPAPLRHLILIPRNRETLYRLALLAEGRHREATPG